MNLEAIKKLLFELKKTSLLSIAGWFKG